MTERRVPLLVKIAPDLADKDVLAVADLALDLGLDGIVATNTTIGRDGLASDPAAVEKVGAGGLSGAPLTARADEVMRLLRGRVGPDLTLVGVGGIADRRRTPGASRRRAPRCCRPTPASCTAVPRGRPGCSATSPVRPGGGNVLSQPFGARLAAAKDVRGPLCAGIDPHASLLARLGADRRRGRAGDGSR